MLSITTFEKIDQVPVEVTVPSESRSGRVHTVRFAESNWHSSCTCEDFRFRRAHILGRDERSCKHIKRVRRFLARFAAIRPIT